MLSAETIGAAASKKCRYCRPVIFPIASDKASEVSGPVAMTVIPSGISVTSPSATVIFGSFLTVSVIYEENFSRSTASAPPASTLLLSAAVIMSEPRRRNSSFNNPIAFVTAAARREFEQTSSAKSGDL